MGYDPNEVQADDVAEASTTPRVIQTVKPSLTSADDTKPKKATGGEAVPADGGSTEVEGQEERDAGRALLCCRKSMHPLGGAKAVCVCDGA